MSVVAPPRLVLEVPDHVPASLNAYMGRSRWPYRAAKRQWLRWVGDAWRAELAARGRRGVAWPMPPVGRVRVTVERITPRADALDADNAHGACKPILDALRELGLLADDTVAAIDLVVAQPKGAPHERRTRVTLEVG